jgi:hypothetical protein
MTREKKYPKATPHTDIEEIAPDVFFVRSKHAYTPGMLFLNRVMVIIRNKGELTLVNSVRLTEAGETELKKLGEPKRVIRLGSLHGRDDEYYKKVFNAELWAIGKSDTYPKPEIDKVLKDGDDLPFPDSYLFVFQGSKLPEGCLLVRKSEGGILICCDSLQHMADDRLYFNFPMTMISHMLGLFKTPTVIGGPWLADATREGESLQSEFERLLTLDFDQHIAAHGVVCKENAKAEVQVAFDYVFKEEEDKGSSWWCGASSTLGSF